MGQFHFRSVIAVFRMEPTMSASSKRMLWMMLGWCWQSALEWGSSFLGFGQYSQ